MLLHMRYADIWMLCFLSWTVRQLYLFVYLSMHWLRCVLLSWPGLSFCTLNAVSPVEHHCAFGILRCFLFHFFLLTPARVGENTTNKAFKSKWVVKGGTWKCQLSTQLSSTQMPVYLLCEKASSATEGATSRGSQARSWWMSCWAPLVKERNDSWKETDSKTSADFWMENLIKEKLNISRMSLLLTVKTTTCLNSCRFF